MQSQKRTLVLSDKNRIDETLQAQHHYIAGYTGSGKTQFIKRHPFYTHSNRVLAWDPEGSFSELQTYTTIKGLARALRAVNKYGNIRARLVSDLVDETIFDQFNELCWQVGHALNPLTLIGEELADVVKAGSAPKYWQFNSRKGRKYGTRILGVSQRPQEVDKTFLNMCRFKWCGILGSHADRKYMSNVMDVPADKLAQLQECYFYLRESSKPAKLGKLTFN